MANQARSAPVPSSPQKTQTLAKPNSNRFVYGQPGRKSGRKRGRGSAGNSQDRGSFWVPFGPPANPPPASDVRPRRLNLQEAVNVTAGSKSAVTAAYFIQSKFGTSGYASMVIHSIIVWNASPADFSDLTVTPASPGTFPNTIVTYESVGSSTKRAAVGYRVSGVMSGPFAPSNTITHVKSSQTGVVIQLDATFY